MKGILFLFFAFSVYASNFPSFQSGQYKVVFPDFKKATYSILYDASVKNVVAISDIELELIEDGAIAFDSVQVPSSIKVDGRDVDSVEISTPDSQTKIRIVKGTFSKGLHRLKMSTSITSLVNFTSGGVKSAFWTSDLDERNFLERYLPASFEYDQVEMVFNIQFKNFEKKQVIYTNGEVKELSPTEFQIKYPSYFNVSSVFYHTVPKGETEGIEFDVKSIDGRVIPVTIYASVKFFGSANFAKLKTKLINVFQELESDYGAFPHPKIIIYNAGSGGMEYCGATMTDSGALEHEIFHSYFARGFMPANGNAGWLDEALASWRDSSYPRRESLTGSSQMSSHGVYARITDDAAYSFGRNFMGYMDFKLSSKGGLKPFMRLLMDKHVFQPMTIDEFIRLMETFYQTPLRSEFKKYTFSQSVEIFSKSGHKIHRKMSLQELENYL